MTTRMYVINTLSNMHVGSGEVNYGVIDNLIQRDSVTNLPNTYPICPHCLII